MKDALNIFLSFLFELKFITTLPVLRAYTFSYNICCCIQVLPLAREFLQLVLRTNLMFFYFEGSSYASKAHIFSERFRECNGRILILLSIVYLQAFIIISQNVLQAFGMSSLASHQIKDLGKELNIYIDK